MAQWNLRRQLEEAEAQRRLAAGLAATADDTLMYRPIAVDGAAGAPPNEAHEAHEAPASPPAPQPPSAGDTIDLREPLAPWHAPSPSEPALDAAEAARTEGSWPGTGLPPRRSAAITLPLWQGTAAAAPPAMAHQNQPATAVPRAGAADPAAPPAAGTDPELVATRQPTKDRCPHCSGKVRLDRFDLVDAVAHMSCTDCGFTYQAKSPKL
jgi:hypothetical protein